jgi:DHA3 family macrolide efflux protein-like MFS transporter
MRGARKRSTRNLWASICVHIIRSIDIRDRFQENQMNVTPANWKKTFFFIWTGQAFSLIGSQMVHFAIAWWLTQSTGSAVVLATMAVFGMLPQVILGPFIGALVDRWNRQRVMIVADSVIAFFTLGLAVLFLGGWIQVWHLYVVALIRGTLGVFHWTAMQASTSLMVPHDQLSRVAGMNQTLQAALGIAAPPLGALVVGFLPMGQIMFIDVITAALAIAPLFLVRIPQPENASDALVTPKMVLADVREGLRYVWAMPGLVIIMAMATLINFLLNPTGVLTPLLITRHFGGGVWHLSAMESSWPIGMIIGGILLSVWGGFKGRTVFTSMTFLVVTGIAVLMVGFAPPTLFMLAVAGNALSGLTNPLVNGPLFAFLQSRVKPEMQGRVFTVVGSMAGAAAPLGMALAAPVADNLGIQVWWIVGGIATILMGIAGFIIPAVRNIDRMPKLVQAPAEIEAVPAD